MSRCWCGIPTSYAGEDRPCVFHGGDLQARVANVLREVTVFDTETGDALKPAQAFIVLCALWRGDGKTTITATEQMWLLGDIAVKGNPWCDASDALGTERHKVERGHLLAEAIMGRWPW